MENKTALTKGGKDNVLWIKPSPVLTSRFEPEGRGGLYYGAELLKYALFAQCTTSQLLRIRQTIQLLYTAPSEKKTSTQISLSLAIYKDLSMNERLC